RQRDRSGHRRLARGFTARSAASTRRQPRPQVRSGARRPSPAWPTGAVRLLVTGGAGFIGSHLVERLVADGHEVRVLDDLSSGQRSNLAAVASSVELIEGDIADPATVARAVADRHGVVHLAAVASV